MDPIDAVSKLWNAATKLKDLAEKVKEADVRMAIADILMDAAELKVQVATLNTTNVALKSENALLQARLDLQGRVIHKPPFFYLEGENKPLCPNCWQGTTKAVYMVVLANGYHQCPVCKFGHSPDFGAGKVESEWDPFRE